VANLFLNTSWISMEVLRNLKNALKIAEYFNHDWEKDYEKAWAVGTTIQVKFPQQFTIRNGLGYNPQGINRISTTISLDESFGIDFQWDDYEAAVKAERSEEEIREQYLAPAGVQLANEWDSRAALFAKNNCSQIVGTLGQDPTSIVFLDQARARLLQKAGSYLSKKRAALISSSMMTNSVNTPVTALFHPGDAVSTAFKEGFQGELKTFDVIEEQNLYSQTAGTWAGAVTVTGSGQSGTSLIITGTAGDTIKQGDKFSIANVNFVNPRSRRPPGPLTPQTFTATQDFTLTGGADTITILPAIYGPNPNDPSGNSQYQNVDNLPVNGAALTLWPGTSNPNGAVGTVGLALTPMAFAIVGMRFYLPKAVEARSQAEDKATGIPVRFVKAWDAYHSLQINRFDTVGGFGNLYQDNACVALLGA
jgi:P22 coat protein - gene protein 5